MSARTPKNPNDETVEDGEGAEPTPVYEIGYRRPPKHSRFKKGQSGNRNGRPKGRKSLSAYLDRELEKKIPVTVNGHRKLISKVEALATQHVNKALGGDPKAMQSLISNDRSKEAEANAAGADGISVRPVFKDVDQRVLVELVSRIRAVDEPIQAPQSPAATAADSDPTAAPATAPQADSAAADSPSSIHSEDPTHDFP